MGCESGGGGTVKLSIIIPAYCEETAILSGKLDPILRLVYCSYPEIELIIIDDGSPDNTFGVAMQQTRMVRNCYVYRNDHQGKAGSLLAGIKMALGDYILFCDMDQATPITELSKLTNVTRAGIDVAIGSRGLARPGAPLSRYILSTGQMILKRLLLGLTITDTQCGFKLWSGSVARHVRDHMVIYNSQRMSAINGPCVSSGFDVEMLLVAQRLGYRIAEVSVAWSHQATRKVQFTRDARRGVVDLWRIFAADMAGLYPHAKLPPNTVRTVLETRK